MIINSAELVEDENKAIAQTVIEHAGKKQRLWYAVDKKFGQYLTHEKLDGFLVGILPLAMESGEDITIQGRISEKLYNNLTEYMNIYNLAVPTFSPIKIIPDSLSNGEDYRCDGKIGTGFTGGVDSFFTVYQHSVKEGILPQEKITHLLFGNVGGQYHLWRSGNSRNVFNSRYGLLKGFAEEYGLDYIKVDSNLTDVVKVKVGFAQYYQPSYLSSPLMLQKLFSKYYYSSVFQIQDSYIHDVDDIARTDYAAVHLLSTETMEIILTGMDFSRVEKTRLIAKNGLARHRLNVCAHPRDDGKNCSICKKCCRTLFTLELLGCIEDYNDVFDLKKWAKKRNFYIANSVLKKKADYLKDHLADHLAEEIREYAESIKYPFTFYQRVLAWIMTKVAQILNLLPRPLYEIIRKWYIKLALPS